MAHSPLVRTLLEDSKVASEDLRYASRHSNYRAHNRLTPLRDGGETYASMLAAIRNAARSIALETYILVDDATGTRFADALIERAQAGITVRLMYDAWGSWSLGTPYIKRLTEAGVEVVEYNPVVPWRARFKLVLLTRRDHRKILIVDDQVAFTGGLNIANDYASEEDGGGGWRDAHLQVQGPIVRDLARLFHSVWVGAGGAAFNVGAANISADQAGDALASVISNRLTKRFQFRRAYLHAIYKADKQIDIMNAYFIPGRAVRRALRRAVARGVQVRVIVPGNSDVKAAQYASSYLYARMLKDGIRIFEWPKVMMHAKTVVIDGVWSTVGSYNFDSQSLRANLEVAVAALDRPLAKQLTIQFDADIARCVEIEEGALAKRSLWHRALQWCAYRLRWFL